MRMPLSTGHTSWALACKRFGTEYGTAAHCHALRRAALEGCVTAPGHEQGRVLLSYAKCAHPPVCVCVCTGPWSFVHTAGRDFPMRLIGPSRHWSIHRFRASASHRPVIRLSCPVATAARKAELAGAPCCTGCTSTICSGFCLAASSFFGRGRFEGGGGGGQSSMRQASLGCLLTNMCLRRATLILPTASRIQSPGLLNQILSLPLVDWFVVSIDLGAQLLTPAEPSDVHGATLGGHLDASEGENEHVLDLLGLRLKQVVKVLRNLALEKSNSRFMARNALVLRFIVRGMASRHAKAYARCFVKDRLSVLHGISVILEGTCLEIFACLGSHVELSKVPEGGEFLRGYLRDSIFSSDRYLLTSSITAYVRAPLPACFRRVAVVVVRACVHGFEGSRVPCGFNALQLDCFLRLLFSVALCTARTCWPVPRVVVAAAVCNNSNSTTYELKTRMAPLQVRAALPARWQQRYLEPCRRRRTKAAGQPDAVPRHPSHICSARGLVPNDKGSSHETL